jgi:hypothetical protein
MALVMSIILNTTKLLYLQWWLLGITKVWLHSQRDKLEYISVTLRSYKAIVSKLLFVNFVLELDRFTHSCLMINCISPVCIQDVRIHKISYLRKIRLHRIHTNLTTAAYIDGSIKETGDQSDISISVDCSVSRSQ